MQNTQVQPPPEVRYHLRNIKEFKQQIVPKEFYLVQKNIKYKIYFFSSVSKLLEPLQPRCID